MEITLNFTSFESWRARRLSSRKCEYSDSGDYPWTMNNQENLFFPSFAGYFLNSASQLKPQPFKSGVFTVQSLHGCGMDQQKQADRSIGNYLNFSVAPWNCDFPHCKMKLMFQRLENATCEWENINSMSGFGARCRQWHSSFLFFFSRNWQTTSSRTHSADYFSSPQSSNEHYLLCWFMLSTLVAV